MKQQPLWLKLFRKSYAPTSAALGPLIHIGINFIYKHSLSTIHKSHGLSSTGLIQTEPLSLNAQYTCSLI